MATGTAGCGAMGVQRILDDDFGMYCKVPSYMKKTVVSVALWGLIMLGSACQGVPADTKRLVTIMGGQSLTSGLKRLEEHLNVQMPATHVTFGSSRGSVENVGKVQRGEADIAFAQADIVYQAFRHGMPSLSQPHSNLRGIAVLWTTTLYMLVRSDSPLRSVAELKGHRIGVGLEGGGAEVFARIILEGYGLRYESTDRTFAPLPDLLKHLAAGTLEVVIAVQPSTAPFRELQRQQQVRVLSIDRTVARDLLVDFPFLRNTTIPAGVLGDSQPVSTLSADMLLICHKDLPEELVYDLTRLYLEWMEANGTALGPRIDFEDAPTTPIPLHPGAARYYREREVVR
jgi:TRAP transporter TAXI family solute receptor